MNFKEAQCPTCGGVLQVPEGLEELTCMYCGKELQAKELLYQKNEDKGQQTSKDSVISEECQLLELYDTNPLKALELAQELFEKDRFHFAGNYILGMEAFPRLLIEHRELAAQFKRNSYEISMEQYIVDSKELLEYIDRACRIKSEEKEQVLSVCVKKMFRDMKEMIPKVAIDSKTKQSFILDDYKMVVALYLIPMILEINLEISEALADMIIIEWVKEYPKMPIRKGSYENIRDGFRKKGFCYITTAVCDTLEKEDDCYELNMFRNFRDYYLLQQEDGQVLIEEYYQVAPIIVERIDGLADRDRIYKNIWNQYLKGCLLAIEEGKDAQCKDMYCQMLLELKKQYIL